MGVNQERALSYKSHYELATAARLGVWLLLSAIACTVLFRGCGRDLLTVFSGGWIFGQFHFFSWIVLALCLFLLWSKRQAVRSAMEAFNSERENIYLLLLMRFLSLELMLAAGLIVIAYPSPPSPDLLIFRILTACTACYLIVFGWKAFRIPAILLAVYGFSVVIPLVINRFTGI